jgi:hypothetical protein
VFDGVDLHYLKCADAVASYHVFPLVNRQPLHIASTASSVLSAGTDTKNNNSVCADEEASVLSDARSMTSFLSSATANSTPYAFDKVIKILLHHYPEAAKIPHGKSGRLPMVLAAQTGQRTFQDGMQALLLAYPAALHSRKLKLQLYPDLLAMVGGGTPKDGDGKPKGCGGGVLHNLSFLAAPLSPKINHRKELSQRSTVSGGSSKRPKGESLSGKKAVKRSLVKPRDATAVFELLKTKPDLVDKACHPMLPSPGKPQLKESLPCHAITGIGW